MNQRPELSFDGAGINGPNEYRDRIATFNTNRRDWIDKYGPLFSAAPELLEIAKKLLPWVETSPGFRHLVDAPLLKKARAAIAKAEGKKEEVRS